MLKLTQGTMGTRSTLLSAEHQSEFHAVTCVLQHSYKHVNRNRGVSKWAENGMLLRAD